MPHSRLQRKKAAKANPAEKQRILQHFNNINASISQRYASKPLHVKLRVTEAGIEVLQMAGQ